MGENKSPSMFIIFKSNGKKILRWKTEILWTKFPVYCYLLPMQWLYMNKKCQ